MDNSISYQPTQLNLKPDFGSIFIVAGRQHKNFWWLCCWWP